MEYMDDDRIVRDRPWWILLNLRGNRNKGFRRLSNSKYESRQTILAA